MSDTARAEPKRRSLLKSCCLLALVGVVLVVAYLGYVVAVTRQPRPLAFEAFRFRPFERSILTAKGELLQLPSRLLTGGTTEMPLNERELNALLFGDAQHADEGPKARVTILPERRLRVESSSPLEDGNYLNVTAELSFELSPGGQRVEIHSGQVGGYALGPLSRGLLAGRIEAWLAERRQRDPDLGRVVAFAVVDERSVKLELKSR